MADIRRDRLKLILDQLYADFDFRGTIARDPIEFPHSYQRPEDREISGLISASFAYGNVNLFKSVLRLLFSSMGDSPYEFVLNFDPKKDDRLFKGVKYRFNENNDIIAFFYILSMILRQYDSIELAFRSHYGNDDPDMGAALSGLVENMLLTDTSPIYGENVKPAGLLQLMPSPAGGSACKRMNLFLRWMIRDRDIDFGIWKGLPGSKLIIPLDTHIVRIGKCLGLTRRSSAGWKMAVDITNSLKELDPEDPLKYDFALCHQGIAGICSAKKCGECRLLGNGAQ
jgi:uncharacterized protein (TIGR02757 family)